MTEAVADLRLYHFRGCVYCERVARELGRLGVEVERADIHAEPTHRSELVEARGRPTVPVLRIADPDGVRYLGESQAIIGYLRQRFGGADAPSDPLGWAYGRWVQPAMMGLFLLGVVWGLPRGAPLVAAALFLGSARSLTFGLRGGLVHLIIGSLYLVGALAIGLDALSIATIPWWYAVFAALPVLFALSILRTRSVP